MTSILASLGALLALAGAVLAAWFRRKPVTPPAVEAKRAAAVGAAVREEAAAKAANAAHHAAETQRDSVDRANDRIARMRAKRGGTALAVLLSLALPAHAEPANGVAPAANDPAPASDAPISDDCRTEAHHVVCTREGFDLLMLDADNETRRADDAEATAASLRKQLAAEQEAAKARTCPTVDVLPWAAGGFAAGVVAVLVVVLATR